MRANEKQIYELTAHVNTLSDTVDTLLRQLAQASPSISGKTGALVALAKDARMDGRVGAGDVTVSVMLAGGGFSIGVIGAAGVWLGGVDLISTGEMLGFCTLSGCTLGILRMSLDALAVPVMLSNLMDWLEDRWHEWLDYKDEETNEQEPASAREIPVFNRGQPAGFVSIPEPTQFKVNTLRIESCNLVEGVREIEVDKVCLFLKHAAATGEWARDRQSILSQKEHPDVKKYLQGWGWWEISSPLAREVCAKLRNGVTNGTERNERNG